MTNNMEIKILREGSAQKRADILVAARNLFLTEGFDHSSVDAVAARAKVSKRTVYDYYGDKRTLLLAVIDEAGQSLMNSIQRAIDHSLTDVTDLEQALIAFCEQIVTSTIGSSDYSALLRLVTMEAKHLPELTYDWLDSAPEEAIAKRFADFGRSGLLVVPDPLLAAKHFSALTFLLAFNNLGPARKTEDTRVKQTIVDGVRAFLRAYAPRTT
jgi:TetR/AcrR family transcriptional repressor of mexJK operon